MGSRDVPRDDAQHRRKHPRRHEKLRVRLFRPSKQKGHGVVDFQASVDTRDVSVGGAFFQSTFFLKPRSRWELELELPKHGRIVRASIEVVHVISEGGRASAGKPPGFAVRFVRFHDDSEIYLRAYLARGDMFRFVQSFMTQHPGVVPSVHAEGLVELLVRWEMHLEGTRKDGPSEE